MALPQHLKEGLMSDATDGSHGNPFKAQEASSHPPCIAQGLIEHRSGRFEKAEGCFREAVAVDERVALYHSYLGCTLRCQGRLDEAAVSYRRALELQPDYPQALYFLGVVLHSQGKLDQAEENLMRAVALRPTDAAALTQLGMIQFKLNNWEAAAKSLQEALALCPDDATALFYTGLSFRKLSQWRAAEKSYEQLLALQPTHVDALLYLGITLQNQKEWVASEQIFRRLLGIRPGHFEALFYLGITLQNLLRWTEAEKCFAQLLGMQPDNPEVLFQMGFILQNQQRWEEAANHFKKATSLQSDYAQAFFHFGYASEQLGRWKEAAAGYSRAAELEPSHDQASYRARLALARSRGSKEHLPDWRIKVNFEWFPTNYSCGNVTVDSELFIKQILNNMNGQEVCYPEARLGKEKHTILLAAMPKSASTFLITCLSNLFEYPHVPLSFHFERSEQDLYLPSLLYYHSINTVSQHHLRATAANTNLINAFSIATIVLVRNLFDALVSLRDHFVREYPVFKGCYVDETFLKMDKQAQYDMLVDLAAPWFISFFVSWYKAVHSGAVKVLWLEYEELVADPINAIAGVCEFASIRRTREEITGAIDKSMQQSIRLNVGKPGRGASELGTERMNRVARMCSYYQDVDFSRIGIRS